jgi:hypothetical protein
MSSTTLDDMTHQLAALEPGSLKAVVLARGLEALLRMTEVLGDKELAQVASEDSNVNVLVAALLQPTTSQLSASNDDPLRAARLRGLKARDELLQAEGGMLKGEEVARLLGCTRQSVDDRRREGKLLAVELGRRGFLYPFWQITDVGLLAGMDRILPLLKDAPPLAQMRFFLSGNHQCGGQRPLDLLRQGNVGAVEQAASSFGEQGAR